MHQTTLILDNEVSGIAPRSNCFAEYVTYVHVVVELQVVGYSFRERKN